MLVSNVFKIEFNQNQHVPVDSFDFSEREISTEIFQPAAVAALVVVHVQIAPTEIRQGLTNVHQIHLHRAPISGVHPLALWSTCAGIGSGWGSEAPGSDLWAWEVNVE